MAKLNSGIMGAVSGKVGGVVGARWKGQAYIRAHVVPGLSQTDLQVAQRARFAYVVAAGKYYVGRVFNPYYDKFLSKVSGFNRFISENIPKAPAYAAIDNFTITRGPLYPGSTPSATYNAVTGEVVFGKSTENGIDGAADDVQITWARHRLSNVTWFGADATRSSLSVTIGCNTGLVATDFDVGCFFAKMNGSLVVKISTNLSCTASAA
jgi:hypothetical protein